MMFSARAATWSSASCCSRPHLDFLGDAAHALDALHGMLGGQLLRIGFDIAVEHDHAVLDRHVDVQIVDTGLERQGLPDPVPQCFVTHDALLVPGRRPPCASAGGAGRVQPLHDLLDLQQPAVAARFSARSAPARRSRIRPWQRPNRSDWPASPSVGSAPVTFLAQNLAFILDLATLLLVGENHDRGAVYFDRDVLFSTPGNSAFRTYLSPASVTSMSMRGKSSSVRDRIGLSSAWKTSGNVSRDRGCIE